jgi:hypothetical protein
MPVITHARPGVLQVTVDTILLPEPRLDGPLATGGFRREERNFGSGDRSHRHLISRSVGS